MLFRSGRLSFEASPAAAGSGAIAAAVHRFVEGANGPVILTVFNGSAASGDAVLQPSDREALTRGELYVGVHSATGVGRAQLQFR